MSAPWTRRPIKAIKANPNNPRLIKDERFQKLVQSIKDFPEMLELRPIVVNAAGVVLGGNMRLKACQAAGLTEVPVITAESLTEAQEREFVIKDNVGFGEWEWDALANDWNADDLTAWGLELPAVDVEPSAGQTDPDDVPDTPVEPVIKLGDLIALGDHRLLCGDCTKPEHIERLLAGAKAGGIVTDPPYGIGIDGQKKSVSNNPKHNRKEHVFMGWDSERPPRSVFSYMLAMQCPTAIFGGNYFADMLPASRGWIYWSKGQDGLTMSDGELAWTTTSKPLRCVTVNRAALHGSVHPTQKPVEVIVFAITYIEPKDGPLFDPFLGSGSTLIAAEQTNRVCYGMEIEPRYCDVIVRRWQEFTGRTATYADTGKPVVLT